MNAETWCSACGAGLRGGGTRPGRRRELEVEPHPDGTHVLVDVPVVGGGSGVRARVLPGTQLPAQEPAYRPHRCPEEDKPEPGPRCAGCHGEMPRDIALEQVWTHHPSCDPDYQLWLTRDRKRRHDRAARAQRRPRA